MKWIILSTGIGLGITISCFINSIQRHLNVVKHKGVFTISSSFISKNTSGVAPEINFNFLPSDQCFLLASKPFPGKISAGRTIMSFSESDFHPVNWMLPKQMSAIYMDDLNSQLLSSIIKSKVCIISKNAEIKDDVSMAIIVVRSATARGVLELEAGPSKSGLENPDSPNLSKTPRQP